MNVSLLAWVSLVLVLCLTTFGLWWCITMSVSVPVFLVGGLTFLYLKNADSSQKYYTAVYRSRQESSKPGLSKVVHLMEAPSPSHKVDCRLTGSQVIDESLREIIGYVLRDYVFPWYDRLSADSEFPHEIRQTAQRVIVTFAGRMKEVDWIPYLTTRLVDDAASHLRLFRQARAKMKQQRSRHKQQPSVEIRTSMSIPGAMELDTKRGERGSSTGKQVESPASVISETSMGGTNNASSGAKPSVDLETLFFDLEVTMEDNLLCRDLVCTEKDSERQYLQDVSEVLLFLLLPVDDFHCKPLRFLLRELLVSTVVLPLFGLVSDPDYINQIIVWLCKEIPMTSDVFLTALRVTDNQEELIATRDMISREIAQLRSRDSGREDDTAVKQQLSSLLYVRKVIENRLQRLKEGADSDSVGLPSHIDWNRLLTPGTKLFSLPLDVVLKNNIALSYFIDYMSSVGAQAYLFFYLNVEGWRVSAEQQISDMELQKLKTVGDDHHVKGQLPNLTLENMKEAAYSIYEQYLSEKASPRLKLDETIVKKLLFRIRSEVPNETWFDEIQAAVYEKLQNEEHFLPGFQGSVSYVKLLAELDLLKDPSSRSDEEDCQSLDEISLSDNISLSSFDADFTLMEGTAAATTDIPVSSILGSSNNVPDNSMMMSNLSGESNAARLQQQPQQGSFYLQAEIIETGVVNDRGKTYGIYAVSVAKCYETGYTEKWHVYRRYSDFHDLHQKVKDKYGDLGKLTFPGKKTFHNMERTVLEKRMKMLNDYMQILLQSGVIDTHPRLQRMLLAFLEQGDYDKGVTGGQIARTLDTIVNPLKSSMRTVGQAVRTMPDNLMSTVDGVMDGISKVFQGKAIRPPGFYESMKVGASLHVDTDDNIPLRIMLLLMDEVFDLKSRNQWLRRRIVTLLRQIIRTMFGDIVNRRILDYVSLMTSPEQVADYLRAFKQSFWPNGCKAEPRLPRDEATRMRTRVAAKVALLSSLSDELKHIIGSETTRRGLLCVFELFQHPVLNRRLLYVLLEGILETLFPQHNLSQVFRKLHSRSGRVRDDFKTSQRTRSDLRR
ncbi:Sorting nexin-13 [Zootermopsis nevadensis]|uniref:Sorting nexin-13 n=3 Tax=Zootermopsis nevadensis TaxID=136037 RepID=A0A067QL85_ZOONE|nr:Sorting nexin-13 [Zootermopsis nevadensis]